ncbi:TetR family transcriptional regulator [Ureibacillus xyleni]|uniref:TetR family transcriptional regulator n=1 Tax=Ureibacillus xyleni TaxID=614648 RepID=A0A285SE70_9BACL|nr:TetR/AcrR family transcriptional regulator [Ureibacillus xyleni]SOC06031.1 TetR family transcriptional regulator [Ureibacillus xyleni]
MKSIGRPRSEASKTAILQAVIQLLEETPFSDLTIERIANTAGVGKATIYRWWSHKTFLVLDAFLMSVNSNLKFHENTTFRENFRQHLYNLSSVLNSSLGRTIISLVAESGVNSELANKFYTEYLKPRREESRILLKAAIAQREIQPSIHLDIVLDMFYGPVYFRLLIYKKEVDSTYVDSLINQVMKGIT